MYVEYKPKDGEPSAWDFTPGEVFQEDAEQVEKHYGRNWDDFLDDVRSGNARARKVLLWHLIRQDHPKLPFADAPRFRMGELVVHHSSTEIRELLDKVHKLDASGVDEERRQAIVAGLNVDLTDALLRERGDTAVDVDEPVGKAG